MVIYIKLLNSKSQQQLRIPIKLEEQSLINSSEHAKLIKEPFCTLVKASQNLLRRVRFLNRTG
jgi:hypothetical protein